MSIVVIDLIQFQEKGQWKKKFRRFRRTILKSLTSLPETLACVDISEFAGNLRR